MIDPCGYEIQFRRKCQWLKLYHFVRFADSFFATPLCCVAVRCASLIQMRTFLRTYAILLSYLFSAKFVSFKYTVNNVRWSSIHSCQKKFTYNSQCQSQSKERARSFVHICWQYSMGIYAGKNHLSLFFHQQRYSNGWRQNAIKSIKFRLCAFLLLLLLFVMPTCSQWFQCTSFINFVLKRGKRHSVIISTIHSSVWGQNLFDFI